MLLRYFIYQFIRTQLYIRQPAVNNFFWTRQNKHICFFVEIFFFKIIKIKKPNFNIVFFEHFFLIQYFIDRENTSSQRSLFEIEAQLVSKKCLKKNSRLTEIPFQTRPVKKGRSSLSH